MPGEVFRCWPGEPDARVWITLCLYYSHPQTPSRNGFLLTSVYTTSVSTSVSFKDIRATISSQLLLTVTVNKPLLNETLSNNDRAQLGECPPGIIFVQKILQKNSSILLNGLQVFSKCIVNVILFIQFIICKDLITELPSIWKCPTLIAIYHSKVVPGHFV